MYIMSGAGTTVAEIQDTRPVFYIAPLPTNPLRHTSSYIYNDVHTILITSVRWIIINHRARTDVR